MKSITEDALSEYNKPTFPIREGWLLKYFFAIPFPPTTGNHQHYIDTRPKQLNGDNFVLKNGKMSLGYKHAPIFRTKKSVIEYRQYLKYYLSSLVKRVGTLDGTLGFYAKIIMPDKRRRDIDNIFKVVFDALTYAGIMKDDKLFKRCKTIVSEEPDKKQPTISFLIFKRGEK